MQIVVSDNCESHAKAIFSKAKNDNSTEQNG